MSKAPLTVIETCHTIEALCLDPYWESGHRWRIEKLARDVRQEVERLLERQIKEKLAAQLEADFQATGGLAL